MGKDETTYIEHSKQLAEQGQQIKQFNHDIQNIYDMVDGVPQRIDMLDGRMSELIDTLNKFMTDLRTDYQTKELCTIRCTQRDAVTQTLVKEYDKSIAELKDQNKWVTRGLVGASLYIIWDLVKAVAVK